MTLEYRETERLVIPPEAFNNRGNARIILSGGSYGAMWVMNAFLAHDSPDGPSSIGAIETKNAFRQPNWAVDAAIEWVRVYCDRNGYKLVRSHNLNHQYGPDDAPFYALATAQVHRRK